MAGTIKVLVVDDTVVYRKILSRIIEALERTELVGTASNGKIALARIKENKPDLVLLDIVMPQMDGIETLKRIHETYPEIGVVMVSSYNRKDADITVEALRLGAIDFIPKPSSSDLEKNYNELFEKVKNLIPLFITRKYLKDAKRLVSLEKEATVEEKIKPVVVVSKGKLSQGKFRIVVIGVSTGGPKVLMEILSTLEMHDDICFLVVQHMPPIFTASLTSHLDTISCYEVREGCDGEEIQPGKILFAPGGKHMVIKKGSSNDQYVIHINESEAVNSCRPSVDVLFEAVAECFKGKSLAVILTGMGSDGKEGVRLLKQKGAYCIAQDEETSVIYGMPKAVIDSGLADEVLPSFVIGERINTLIKI